jgi:alpha/beta superfamily hydrolase
MMTPLNVVYFSHGKESGPWGIKIKRLARIALSRGFAVESPDYQGLDDPDARVAKLLSLEPAAIDKLVLAGSSMGGYVAAAASEKLSVQGLFLMAPAVLLAGFGRQDIAPRAAVKTAVHGWGDDVIPPEQAVRFCRDHHIGLHLLNCGHALIEALPTVEALFAHFLDQVVQAHGS